MADFRKWFFAIVALAVLVGVTADTAAAQSFQCQANAGVPARVRGEGRTELVGEMLLNCNGNVASTGALYANIQIFLSTNITSKITNSTTNATEALLMLGDPLPTMQCLTPNLISAAPQVPLIPSCGTGSVWATYQNVYQGVKAGDNSLLWLNVPIVVPPATTQVIRITNVRANANQAYSQGQTFIPQQITMFVTVTSSVSIPINNPTQVVAAVLKGLDFAVVKCSDDTSSTSVSGQQCVKRNETDPTATDHVMDALLKYSEGFDAAFKIRKSLLQDGANLGTLFNSSESGYINSGANLAVVAPYGLGSTIGFANTGTRLLARFANIPTGVLLFVTNNPTVTGTTSTIATQSETSNSVLGTRAVLVSVTDPTGSGGSKDFPISYSGKYSGCSTTSDMGVVQVPLFGGAGAATWEIIASSPGAVETIAFGVETAWAASPSTNSPALTAGTSGTVAGSFAPISSDDKMSATSPIPRFADISVGKTLIDIGACVTNLLFPFVSARGGFDTGMAISNTTLDNSVDMPGGTNKVPFNTTKQNGACTLYYFGDKEDGTSLSKPIQTSGVINAGKQLVYTLFGGGSGIDATPGFQGYIIARCAFQKGHGFAFISDLGAQKLALGYLALIMGDSTSSRDVTGSAAERLDN
jgi:hypothetical protein